MTILVAFEQSGTVRDAFIQQGYDAVSCDLMPSDSPGPHYQCDVRELLQWQWGMVIAHPPCTRLANSGVSWLHRRNLWDDLDEACDLFLASLNANAPLVAVENPTMHRYAIQRIGRKPDFAVHPYHFGDPASKRTCFWTRGLPDLMPTNIISGADNSWMMSLGPSEDRAKVRSKTFTGMAEAMVQQWGPLVN